jgi:predicted enzyme related to lactoylglutathione lyase
LTSLLPPLPHSLLPQLLLTNGAAKQFYTTVFNWQFMPQEAQSEAYPPDRIAFFSPPDKKRSPGGAISKVDGDTRITKAPGGNAMLYLMVDDLGEYMKVSLSSVYSKALELFKQSMPA